MNKKIYYDDKYIEFIAGNAHIADDLLFETYRQLNEKNLLEIKEKLLDDRNKKNIRITGGGFQELFNRLKTQFIYIEAAGGFIENAGQFLFIHRHGKWDLPKGKLEKDEATEHAAVRECEEECGVSGLRIKFPLSSTFHIYPHKKDYALKQTYWYYMDTDYSGELAPQLEEDIHQVKWCGESEIRSVILPDTYYTIADVIKEGLLKTKR